MLRVGVLQFALSKLRDEAVASTMPSDGGNRDRRPAGWIELKSNSGQESNTASVGRVAHHGASGSRVIRSEALPGVVRLEGEMRFTMKTLGIAAPLLPIPVPWPHPRWSNPMKIVQVGGSVCPRRGGAGVGALACP